MQRQMTGERLSLAEWARLETYHPAVQLMAQWAWSRPSRGEPPLSPGGFADYVGVSRKVVSRWLQTAPTDVMLSAWTFPVAQQIAQATGISLRLLLVVSHLALPEVPLYDATDAWAYVLAEVEHTDPEDGTFLPADPPARQPLTQEDKSRCLRYLRALSAHRPGTSPREHSPTERPGQHTTLFAPGTLGAWGTPPVAPEAEQGDAPDTRGTHATVQDHDDEQQRAPRDRVRTLESEQTPR